MFKIALFINFLITYFLLGNANDEIPILRVVGGSVASVREFSHSVLLVIGNHLCGGSIITSRAILTAAHCYVNENHSQALIGAETPALAPQKISIVKTVIHELFLKNHLNLQDNDIAIAFTEIQIVFSDIVKKVVLANGMYYTDKTVGHVAGWGETTIYNELPAAYNIVTKTLKSTQQRVHNWYNCKKVFKTLSPNMICAGDDNANNRIYRGDSGSALVVDGYIQIGIVSFGVPLNTSLTVYTKILPFTDWIENTVKKLQTTYCTPE